jgi:hypothetical protein
MFDWLGEKSAAARLETAVARVTNERKVGTYDVGLKNSTLEVAEEVARYAAGRNPSPSGRGQGEGRGGRGQGEGARAVGPVEPKPSRTGARKNGKRAARPAGKRSPIKKKSAAKRGGRKRALVRR